MGTKARGIRLPQDLEQEVQREIRLRSATFTEIAVGLLREAVRMRRVPGIVFMDGPAGRRAIIAGTGLNVWEVVAAYKALGEDYERLLKFYGWLTERQLRGALTYYQLYREEIDVRVEREVLWTPERVRQEFPFLLSGRSHDAPSGEGLEG